MSAAPPARALLRHLANLLAPGLVFLPSFVAFVQFQGYPLWRPEVLVITGLLILAGLPIGLLLIVRPRTFGAAAVTLLLLVWLTNVFVEDVANLFELWDGFNKDLVAWAGPIGGLAIGFVAALTIVAIPITTLSLLGKNLGFVLATVFGVTLLSTLLLPAAPVPLGETFRRDTAEAKDLPLVVHLVFDEQIGIDGLPADIAGGDELRNELRRFYESFGFTLYGRAYSEYSRTRHSVVALLNGLNSLDGVITEDPSDYLRLYWNNRWFQDLAERGYLINVYHMNGWDYCGGEVGYAARCVTYTSGSITNIEHSRLTVDAKARVILTNYLRTLIPYRAYKATAGPAGWPPRVFPEEPALYAPDSLSVFEQMLTDIRTMPRGAAYFAHLMIPHVTHMLDQDCRIRPDPLTWTGYGEIDLSTGAMNTRESRSGRYARYFDQVRCLHTALRRFLEGLKEIGAFEDAIVVLHGDHGSRIARVAPLTTMPQPLSDQDLADMYSVLYAVRSPSLEAGYREDLVSIQAQFRETFLGAPRAEDPAEVYLDYPATLDSSPTPPPFPRRPMSGLGRAPESS